MLILVTHTRALALMVTLQSASTVHAIQSQRDDREVGRPNARKIRPLPAWANFEAVGVRGERESN